MSDISKCRGKGCRNKESCYRFTSPNSKFQSYANFEDQLENGTNCESYWPVKAVLELMKSILYHKDLYYHGQPKISDCEYDKLEDSLREIDPNNPVLELAGWDIEGKFDYLK